MTTKAAHQPALAARSMLVAAALGTCYLGFFGYKAGGFDDPHALDARLLGQAPAPEQYRVGVYWLAHWIAAHLHVAPTMALAALDGVAATAALLLLFGVLQRSAVYANASRVLRWFAAAAFVLLATWFMGWLLWLQKPETLPAAALVAAMLWLWQPKAVSLPASQNREMARLHLWVEAFALVLVSTALATFRADVACLLNVGVCIYLLLRDEELSLPRPAALLTAALGACSAGGLQLWLMRIVYPAASYGRVKMWQLWPNLKHGSRWPPFAIFLLPLTWMAVQGLRHGLPKDAPGRAFLLAAFLYAALWVAIGKIDEVRIFLPFAFALTPLTVQVAMQRIEPEGVLAD